MISILSFLLASYIMIAVSYTCESMLNKEMCIKCWYLGFIGVIYCLSICWIYFPCDLGHKLYKKLDNHETLDSKR